MYFKSNYRFKFHGVIIVLAGNKGQISDSRFQIPSFLESRIRNLESVHCKVLKIRRKSEFKITFLIVGLLYRDACNPAKLYAFN
jgi:hypothetical protein